MHHKPRQPPHKPRIIRVRFHKPRKGNHVTGTVSLSPVVATDHVSSRQVVVTVNGVALPPIEAVTTPAQFTCADGDSIIVVDTDVNAAGSTSSAPFATMATLPLQPPTAPSVLGVTFA